MCYFAIIVDESRKFNFLNQTLHLTGLLEKSYARQDNVEDFVGVAVCAFENNLDEGEDIKCLVFKLVLLLHSEKLVCVQILDQ